MKIRTGLPTFLAAATAACAILSHHGATAGAVNDTVITYPGAGVRWNSSDLFHNIVWDVNKIPTGYLEDAVLELHHKSFKQPMNLASNVNVTQCHKLIPVPAVNDSDTYQVVMVVNYPAGALSGSSSGETAGETGAAVAPTDTNISPVTSTPMDESATESDTLSSTPSSSPTADAELQGMRRRHAIPNPYPYPDAASVMTITSLTTTTATVQASGADSPATSGAPAALSSAAAARSSASVAMSSASAALASVSAAMSAPSPTSDLTSASTDTPDSGTELTGAVSSDASGSATTAALSLDGSGTAPSSTSLPNETMGGQDGTSADAPNSTGMPTAAQTTSTSFVGGYFAIHPNTVSASAAAPSSL